MLQRREKAFWPRAVLAIVMTCTLLLAGCDSESEGFTDSQGRDWEVTAEVPQPGVLVTDARLPNGQAAHHTEVRFYDENGVQIGATSYGTGSTQALAIPEGAKSAGLAFEHNGSGGTVWGKFP